jgi:hypothetical protein
MTRLRATRVCPKGVGGGRWMFGLTIKSFKTINPNPEKPEEMDNFIFVS